MERSPRSNRSRSRRRVVDQVRALQVYPVSAEVPDLNRGAAAQALLERAAPLLNVLRRCMRFLAGEADGCLPQRCLPEIQLRRVKRGWRREVVGLLRFGKYVRNIVTLVAPGVHIHRGEENSE